MKARFTRISHIAAAVSLALGSGLAFAQEQDPASEEQQPGFEQRSEQPRPGAGADRQAGSEQARDTQSAESEGGLEQVAEENPDLSRFVEAVNAAGLADALTSGSNYTIFAPTNEALEDEDIDSLLEDGNHEELVALLRAHIVADDVDREMAGQIGIAQTIDGGTIELSVEDEKLMVGDAEAMDSEIETGNLRVYAVDAVLPSNPAAPQAAANTRQQQAPGAQQDAFGNEAETEESESEALPQ